MDGYKSMSRNQAINLISPTPRPAFEIEEYIAKFWKRELKDFIYYNYGYLSSKRKILVYWALNKQTVNRFNKYTIRKDLEQNKPTLTCAPIKRSKSTKKFEIDVKEDTRNHYEPEKIHGALNNKYFEYKGESDKNTSIKQ